MNDTPFQYTNRVSITEEKNTFIKAVLSKLWNSGKRGIMCPVIIGDDSSFISKKIKLSDNLISRVDNKGFLVLNLDIFANASIEFSGEGIYECINVQCSVNHTPASASIPLYCIFQIFIEDGSTYYVNTFVDIPKSDLLNNEEIYENKEENKTETPSNVLYGNFGKTKH